VETLHSIVVFDVRTPPRDGTTADTAPLTESRTISRFLAASYVVAKESLSLAKLRGAYQFQQFRCMFEGYLHCTSEQLISAEGNSRICGHSSTSSLTTEPPTSTSSIERPPPPSPSPPSKPPTPRVLLRETSTEKRTPRSASGIRTSLCTWPAAVVPTKSERRWKPNGLQRVLWVYTGDPPSSSRPRRETFLATDE
jgi:hypothetical protein